MPKPGMQNWRTPKWVIDRINDRFPIGLDIAATKNDSVCDDFLENAFSGISWRSPTFSKPWSFCNPPFRDTARFLSEGVGQALEHQAKIIFILRADPTTKWAEQHMPLCKTHFILPRIKFINPETGEEYKTPPFGVMMLEMSKETIQESNGSIRAEFLRLNQP
jgi:phage N-6-adenine-methyltransferase